MCKRDVCCAREVCAVTCGGRRWLAVLKMIELHVYVALADDELCDNIVIVSDCFFMYISVCVRVCVCVCVCVCVSLAE